MSEYEICSQVKSFTNLAQHFYSSPHTINQWAHVACFIAPFPPVGSVCFTTTFFCPYKTDANCGHPVVALYSSLQNFTWQKSWCHRLADWCLNRPNYQPDLTVRRNNCQSLNISFTRRKDCGLKRRGGGICALGMMLFTDITAKIPVVFEYDF